MENASKALVIAGGILVAIMVISTLLYAMSTWKIIPQAQDSSKEIDQIAKFNMEFESFDKDYLYGADLISVLNKAINNNDKYDAVSTDDPMFINIHFRLDDKIETIAEEHVSFYDRDRKFIKGNN